MYIYNTTFAADPVVEDEMIEWLRGEFIPLSTADGAYFTDAELMAVLPRGEQNSYALHMRAESLGDIELWYADHGSRLFDHAQRRWGGRVVFFTTTLQVL